MVLFSSDLCIGCGQCVKDCFRRIIEIKNGKAQLISNNCIACCHCVAVCPVGAVSYPDYPMEDVEPMPSAKPSPTEFLSFIKARRAVRQFTHEPVSDDDINMLISAGRWCPTAKNAQPVSYIVVKNKEIQTTLRGLATEKLEEIGRSMLGTPEQSRGESLIEMRKDFLADPNKNDRLFFHAPVILLVVSDQNSRLDAAAAAQCMELMAFALDLGVLYSGYFCAAAAGNDKIAELVGLPEGKTIVRCLVIGHPAVRYYRTAPRKLPEVTVIS